MQGRSLRWMSRLVSSIVLLVACSSGPALVATALSAAEPEAPLPGKGWKPLWDGKSLKNWSISDFGGQGEITIADGKIVMQQGAELTGIHWSGDPLPLVNYEIALEAQRIDGSDFFCGIVFPVKKAFCSFVVGGWGGGVVGLSSVDGLYASENDTASFHTFKDETWYRIRLRVGSDFIQAWIDNKPVVDLNLTNRAVSLHPALSVARPLGISCFSTVAALRNIQWRELPADEQKYAPILERK